MRTISQAVTMTASDPNGVSSSGIENGAVTIDGALASGGVATFDVPRFFLITGDDVNVVSVTFTVVGTNRYGNVMTEAIAGPTGAATAGGTKNFKTITSITTSGSTVGLVQTGTDDSADGAWIPLDHYMTPFEVRVVCAITAGANLTYGLDMTLSDVMADGFMEDDAVIFDHGTVNAETASVNGVIDKVVRAVRLAVTGFVGGTVTMQLAQSGQ